MPHGMLNSEHIEYSCRATFDRPFNGRNDGVSRQNCQKSRLIGTFWFLECFRKRYATFDRIRLGMCNGAHDYSYNPSVIFDE